MLEKIFNKQQKIWNSNKRLEKRAERNAIAKLEMLREKLIEEMNDLKQNNNFYHKQWTILREKEAKRLTELNVSKKQNKQMIKEN